MNKTETVETAAADYTADTMNTSAERWQTEYEAQVGENQPIYNRSGIKIEALYTPLDKPSDYYIKKLGFPGQEPMTRGIYPTMHPGRTLEPAATNRSGNSGAFQCPRQKHA